MTSSSDTPTIISIVPEGGSQGERVPDEVRGVVTRNVDAAPGQYDPEVVELALAAIQQCRTTLMLTFRFMDAALWRMPLEPAPILSTVGTDGMTMWFNPVLTLRRFQYSANELARDILHSLLHCILRQPFDKTHENTRAWWLACDMTIEAMAHGIAGRTFPSAWDESCTTILNDFRDVSEVLTPEKLYELLDMPMRRASAKGDEAMAPFKYMEGMFRRDDHNHWPQFWEDAKDPNNQQAENTLQSESDGESRASDEGEPPQDDSARGGTEESTGREQWEDEAHSPDNHNEDSDHQTTQEQPTETGGDEEEEGGSEPEESTLPDPEPYDPKREEAEQAWENISLQIQEDLETYSRASSDACFLANIKLSNRRPVNYADFLRRFSAMREDMKINDDEFDYIYYTYGLDHYDNMPLIEPLEYQEQNRVREFVIAIDTSGSCAGDLVQNFIDRTFQILRESEGFGGQVNIHIVQCDTEIREDTKITSMDELQRFGDSFQVKGMGGTDFRPVFEFVDDLLADGEFEDLRGLIYFTDGYGAFPRVAPKYDTAFVFVENQGDMRNVPPWAMKVVLGDEELKVL